LDAYELPREIEKLDPGHIAVDIYNTGVIVFDSAVLITALAVLVVAAAHGAPPPVGSPMDIDSSTPPVHVVSPWGNQGSLINGIESNLYLSLKSKTVIDYNRLLFHSGTLSPGASIRGLLFFKTRKSDWDSLKLKIRLQPQPVLPGEDI
jgi:hypothetical protein